MARPNLWIRVGEHAKEGLSSRRNAAAFPCGVSLNGTPDVSVVMTPDKTARRKSSLFSMLQGPVGTNEPTIGLNVGLGVGAGVTTFVGFAVVGMGVGGLVGIGCRVGRVGPLVGAGVGDVGCFVGVSKFL